MRNHYKFYFILGFFVFVPCFFGLAQVGINSNNSAPDASAGLDVNFTNKGFLPPRVALTALNSALPVTAPAEGLLVYNTALAGTPPNNVTTGYYCWSGSKWMPVIAPRGTSVGDMQYWNGTQWVSVPAGLNGQALTFTNGIPVWTQPVTNCGFTFTVNHQASGGVAPVNKMVSYGTVTSVPGEPSKCWISRNLGADHQATAFSDTTEASAGWYWQFNRKQGYKFDGTNRTPNTPWIYPIYENSDWLIANDPCNLELGSNWHIPTSTEWQNVNNAGDWANNFNGSTGGLNEWYYSPLRMHAGRYLIDLNGNMNILSLDIGVYWSNASGGIPTNMAYSINVASGAMGGYVVSSRAQGCTLRCIRDY
ncbi:MAG: hypothetical protein WCP32_08275 [Bacteroidota bacterium]